MDYYQIVKAYWLVAEQGGLIVMREYMKVYSSTVGDKRV